MAYIDTLRARFLADARTYVDLRSPTGAPQAGGFKSVAYASILPGHIRAIWENAHGSEAILAAGQQYVDPATVTVRYRSGLTPKLRVYLRGDESRPYEVISVNDIENRHEYVELKVRRAVGT